MLSESIKKRTEYKMNSGLYFSDHVYNISPELYKHCVMYSTHYDCMKFDYSRFDKIFKLFVKIKNVSYEDFNSLGGLYREKTGEFIQEHQEDFRQYVLLHLL